MSDVKNMDLENLGGLFSFGNFGGSLMTSDSIKKPITKKKSTAQIKEPNYPLPLSVMLDGGLPVVIEKNGTTDTITKKEVMLKLAEVTQIEAFVEHDKLFSLRRIQDGHYLVRPCNTCEIAKGDIDSDQIFMFNEIKWVNELFEETEHPDGIHVEDLSATVKKLLGCDVIIYKVGDMYFPVSSAEASDDFHKLSFPITVHALTGSANAVIDKNLYILSANTLKKDPSAVKDTIEKDILLQCVYALFPFYEEVCELIVNVSTNSITVTYKQEKTALKPYEPKKEESYPTDAVISLVFTKIKLEPGFFGGKAKATASEIIRYLQRHYPEYSKERTELRYDKKLKLIMPILKSGKRGAENYVLDDTPEYRYESSVMMDVRVYKNGSDEKNEFTWKLPKIPYKIFHDIIHFFWDVYVYRRSEAILLVYYNQKTNTYFVHAPKQRATSSMVEFDREPITGLPVMEIHSHAAYGAFWSQQDNSDELSHCLYGVIGDLPTFRFDHEHVIVRAGTGGLHMQINPADVFDSPKTWENIHKWMRCFC